MSLSVPLVDPDLAPLLESVLERTGADFRDWRAPAVQRRLREGASGVSAPDAGELRRRAEADPSLWPRLAAQLASRPPAWFSDPRFFRALRSRVAPLLKTYPSVRVWVPEEPGGDEAYALAVVLAEEGLLDRSRIYVTTAFEAALEQAREGRFDAAAVRAGAADYARGGGTAKLEEYFTFAAGIAKPSERLTKRMLFGQHSVATDGSLNEFHLIVCRRALSDFNVRLRDRVHGLFWESLPALGILATPPGETPPPAHAYTPLDGGAGLFRRAC